MGLVSLVLQALRGGLQLQHLQPGRAVNTGQLLL